MVLANPRSRSGREDRAAAHVAAKRCRSPPVANRTRRGRGCREAKRDAAMGIARQIGKLQVQLDELRDECLHEELASMEVPA